MTSHFTARPRDRVSTPKLALAMAIVWLTNCLYATPDTGPSSRTLLTAVLPLRPRIGMQENTMPFTIAKPRADGEDDEDDGAELAPCHPFGMFFLKDVHFSTTHPIPEIGGMTLASQNSIDDDVFEYFFGTSYEDYKNGIYDNILFAKVNPKRTRNKVKQRPHVPEPGREIPIVFNLQNGNKKIRKGQWLVGRMVHGEVADRDVTTRNAYVSAIYHQLMLDVIAKSPNPQRNGDPYCKINKKHFARVDDTVFRSLNPGASFRTAHMKYGSPDDWDRTFNHLFPRENKLKVGAQNYPGCAYYRMWRHFIEEVNSDRVVEKVRMEIRKKFQAEVNWFPWAKSDKLWESTSKTYKDVKVTPGLSSSESAPWLLIKHSCTWKEDMRWTPRGVVPVRFMHSVSDTGLLTASQENTPDTDDEQMEVDSDEEEEHRRSEEDDDDEEEDDR